MDPTYQLEQDVSVGFVDHPQALKLGTTSDHTDGLGDGWYARLGNLLNQFTEICQNTASLAVLPGLHPVSGYSRALKITM